MRCPECFAAAANAAEQISLEEVIVLAQKRPEEIGRVPMAPSLMYRAGCGVWVWASAR